MEHRPFWNTVFTFMDTNEVARFSVWNSTTDEDLGTYTLKYKDLKIDQCEAKTLSLKNGKGKLHIRIFLIPMSTPFDPMFRLLTQKEEVLQNVFDLADQLNADYVSHALVSFLHFRAPELLPSFLAYAIKSSAARNSTVSRTTRKAVATYVLLYREMFLDDCIGGVVSLCFEEEEQLVENGGTYDARILRKLLSTLLVDIKVAVADVPEKVQEVFLHLAAAHREEGSGAMASRRTVLDVFFVSIICPALVVPVQLGIFADPKNPERPTPRILMSVSNLMKVMANGTQFPEGSKHHDMNEYLEMKQSVLDEIYESITRPPSDFLRCITKPVTRKLLREFLKKNHCEENLDFWEAVQKYKAADTPQERVSIGKALFKKYLAQGSEAEINVDVEVRRRIDVTLHEECKAPTDLFAEAENWVYQLMGTGSYVGLIKSKMWKEYKGSIVFVDRDLFMPYSLSLFGAGEAIHIFMSEYLGALEPHVSPDVAMRNILEGIGEVTEGDVVPAPTSPGRENESSMHKRVLNFCELLENQEEVLYAVTESIALRRKDHVAISLYALLSAANERLGTLHKMISHSIRVDLFQNLSAGITMKLLGSYVQLVREHYLDVIKPVVLEIVNENVNMEIDKVVLKNSKLLEQNYRNMRHYASAIISALTASSEDIPSEIRSIARLVLEQGKACDAPEGVIREVFGNMIFHRFVCPAIVQPGKYLSQFCEVPLSASRSLILLSKFLVNIGTGLTFPDDNPLSSLNPFIRQNRESVQVLYDKLVAPPLQGFAACMARSRSRAAFTEFLKSRASEENMLFYLDILRYEKMGLEARKQEAQVLYNKYVASGSEMEVNLNGEDQQAILNGLEAASPYLFEGAKGWVYQLMGSGMYMKFSISPEGKAALKDLPHAVSHLAPEDVEKHGESVFAFLRSNMDELRVLMAQMAPAEAEDMEAHAKEVEGHMLALRNIVGDAVHQEMAYMDLGTEKDAMAKAVECMLYEDEVVAMQLFDAVRDAEQSYVCYCLTYLFYKRSMGPKLFRHALKRDFEYEKIGISNLKENFVLQLMGKYLRLHREDTFENFVTPPIVKQWEIYIEGVSRKGEKKQKLFLDCVSNACSSIVSNLCESAFDLPPDIRDLSRVIFQVLQEQRMELLFPRLMSELIFRNYICSFIKTEQAQIVKNNNIQTRNMSKKDSKRQIVSFDSYLSSVIELLMSMSSGNSISPSSPLSQLNEFVHERKVDACKFFQRLAEEKFPGLRGCLQSARTRRAFRQFLMKTHSEENMDFWDDVEEYRTITNPRDLKDKAMKIYIKYMAAGSDHMIVIEDAEKNRIKKLLLKPTRELFDVAQAGAFEHMSTSSYLSFTVSNPDSKPLVERSKVSLEPTGMREVFFSAVMEHIEVILFRCKELGALPASLDILSSIHTQHSDGEKAYDLPVPPHVVSEVLARNPKLYRAVYIQVRQQKKLSVAEALLDMLAISQEGMQFLKWAIDHEMSTEGERWYKEGSLIVELMHHFVQIQRGTYLKDTVSHLSYEIVRQGIELQIAAGSNSMLCKYAESILSLLTDTIHDVPDEIRELCRHLVGITGESRQLLGPLLFEHFVCNGIFSPDLLQRLPDTAAKRSLVILARLVCNIGAGKLFDENDILFQLNPFVERSNPQVIEILKKLVSVDETQQTLLACLKSKKKRMGFRDFLVTPSKSKSHLLELWEEIQQFNSSIDEGERTKRAQGIYNKYLMCKDRDLGIDSKLRSEVKKELSNPSSLTFMPIMRFLLQSLDKEYRVYVNTSRHIHDEYSPTPPSLTKGAMRSSACEVHAFLAAHINDLRDEAFRGAIEKLQVEKPVEAVEVEADASVPAGDS
eukprot:TRINITY_DN6431_c0_g1_i2.p1 TRINITY_DN6431_c0_g1~~TRINITY_DN6431_c0_g1_i2.p1  ORF type:complete len:2030 (-),score=626.26 TRINITY_DN6431_c0_g1_i2:965-6469(-)